jgi:hypothetical protein
MDDQIQIALSLLHSIEKLTEAVIHHNIQHPYTGLSNQCPTKESSRNSLKETRRLEKRFRQIIRTVC